MFRKTIWHGYAWAKGQRRLRHWWRTLDRFATLPSEAARLELGQRLLAQLRYFAQRDDALPQWREAARLNSVDGLWEVWPSLPIITKCDLQHRFHPRRLAERGVRGHASSTGGSTGEPTPFLHDDAMRQATAAVRTYCHLQMGWRPGMATICLWGADRDIGKRHLLRKRFSEWCRNRHIVDGFALDDATVDQFLTQIARHDRVAVYGFSSMLQHVAQAVIERGLAGRHRVHAAWNGGEMLFANQVALFQDAFGTPIHNMYGGRELSAMAFQPAAEESLQVLRPLLMVEIVDDQGNVVEPGQQGRLVLTSTVCRGTPFLRYDIGDVGVAQEDDHDAAGIRAITSLCGRLAGTLTLPGGKTVSALYFNHLMKEFPEVAQFQVALQSGGNIELRLKGARLTSTREKHLRNVLRNFLGDQQVHIVWMDQIPRTAQGKLLQVVRDAA